MTKQKEAEVQCLQCKKTVPVSQAVLDVPEDREPEQGFYICDACRLWELGPREVWDSDEYCGAWQIELKE